MSTDLSPADNQLMISIYLKRDKHENGMTLEEYANGVIAGTFPALDHDAFVYQFGAVEDQVALVVEWAVTNNLEVVELSQGTASVKVNGTVEQFNNIFNITLQTVTENDRTYYTHDGDITLPSEINDVVQSVIGLDNTVSFRNNAILDTSTPGDLEPNLISNPSPVDLSYAYKFPSGSGTYLSQGKGSCVGIISLGGGYTTQNLTSTFSRISQPNPTVVDVGVDGATNSPNYDPYGGNGENMLDIYCSASVAPSAKIVMYFAPNSFQGFIDAVAAATNDSTNNPSVISISWGTTDSNFVYYGLLSPFEIALQAAVVKGITVFVAAGDFGVRAVNGGATYTVQYPATSPYVICAGGTVMSINNDYSIASEVPWGTSGGSYAGGGGVSAVFSVPSWQTGFNSKLYPGGTVSSLTGRGIPDVSAHATGYFFYYGPSNASGSFVGTSATAPLLAGMMARLNQLTGRRIGFVNTDWYSAISSAFNDQITGDNHGGNTVGYSATAGWDACTGLGSPKGTELYKLYKTGTTFPRRNDGFRPSTGAVYPRNVLGIR
jgi:kumamolisin